MVATKEGIGMDRLVRKDFMAGENIRSAGEGFTAASAAYLNIMFFTTYLEASLRQAPSGRKTIL